jgi:amino acid transporter
MELVAIAASETESPRRNITKAVHRVLYRIIIFYVSTDALSSFRFLSFKMLGVLMFGMLVAHDDPALLQSSGTAAQSPFVIAMSHTGVKVLPHVVNGAILTSAFSAGNSFLFCSSRILYGLAIRGQAPHFLARCTKSGLPRNAVLISSIFSLLSFMESSSGAETVFEWLVNISTTAGFLSWLTMNFTYIYFYQAIQAQDRDVRENAYNNKFQPYLAYWGCAWTVFFILINGFKVFFGKFKASGFITAYINIPIFFFMYAGYKCFKDTKVWTGMERDLVSGIPDRDETELPEVPPKNTWERIFRVIF